MCSHYLCDSPSLLAPNYNLSCIIHCEECDSSNFMGEELVSAHSLGGLSVHYGREGVVRRLCHSSPSLELLPVE